MALELASRPAGLPLSQAGGLPPRRPGSSVGMAEIKDAVPMKREARMSGMGEPQYLNQFLDVNKIQAALRSAERGDTWLYFTIVKGMVASYTHLQSEWAKRKGVIVGQPYSLIPYDKDDADDVIACEVIRQMIDGCRNWREGCLHLLDATLMPLSVAEKIFEPVSLTDAAKHKYPLRYQLKEIAIVQYELLCFKVAYLSMGAKFEDGFNPDDWEAWLRIYRTFDNGVIDFSTNEAYRVEEDRHIVHRGNMLSPSIPPNWGGQIRAALFWYLLATQDRDWWAIMMQKYGSPFILGKADAQQMDTVQFLQAAFSLATQIGGLVIDKKAEAELIQANSTDGSNSHKIFNDFCNCEISKLIVGQVLSSTPKNTGLGSGMADQAEGVREDIKNFDQSGFSETLEKQLFEQCLRINGYRGRAPKIFFGGIKIKDATMFTKGLAQLKQGGYRLTADALLAAEEKLGYAIEYDPNPAPAMAGGGGKDDE